MKLRSGVKPQRSLAIEKPVLSTVNLNFFDPKMSFFSLNTYKNLAKDIQIVRLCFTPPSKG